MHIRKSLCSLQMVILYKDPRGEFIFNRSMSQVQGTITSLNDAERDKLRDLEVYCRDIESRLGKYEVRLIHKFVLVVYSGTPQCGPPEKRTPRLSRRFVAVPNDLTIKMHRSAPLRYGHLDNPECGHCAVHAPYSTIVKFTQ